MSDFTPQQIATLRALADFMGGAMKSTGAPSSGGPSSGETPVDDYMLDNEWASEREIQKDPPKWDGPSMVGRLPAHASPEWHECNASFYFWKADKEKAEDPIKLQTKGKNAGKPWHESSTFNGRLALAWARRLRSNPRPLPAAAQPPSGAADPLADEFGAGSSDIPFATSAPTLCPHAERATRGLRW